MLTDNNYRLQKLLIIFSRKKKIKAISQGIKIDTNFLTQNPKLAPSILTDSAVPHSHLVIQR